MTEPIAMPTNPQFQNLTGRVFGKLTAVAYVGKSKKKYSLWLCSCECGGTHTLVSTSLTRGLTKSCTKCPENRPTERACTCCGKVLPFNEEHFAKHDAHKFGLRPRCKACMRERANTWAKKHGKKLRMMILNHYCQNDPRCSCCEERRVEFLSVDHINGGGAKERREYHVYSKIRREKFPPTYRVLCHNCNFSLGIYGYCPHRKEKQQASQG